MIHAVHNLIFSNPFKLYINSIYSNYTSVNVFSSKIHLSRLFLILQICHIYYIKYIQKLHGRTTAQLIKIIFYIICPSVEIITISVEIGFPLFFTASLTANSIPPQQGTDILTTVILLISFPEIISVSFSE